MTACIASVTSGERTTVHRIVEYSHHLVPDIDHILSSSYYWGVMDRFEAEQLLDGKPEGITIICLYVSRLWMHFRNVPSA